MTDESDSSARILRKCRIRLKESTEEKVQYDKESKELTATSPMI